MFMDFKKIFKELRIKLIMTQEEFASLLEGPLHLSTGGKQESMNQQLK